jgi:hypothetical protein
VRVWVNDQEHQRATLRSDVRGVAELVEYWSGILTLEVCQSALPALPVTAASIRRVYEVVGS